MAVVVKHLRITRSQLNARASGGTIEPGQVYAVTDEKRLALGLTTTTFETYAPPVRGVAIFCGGKPGASELIGGGIAPYDMTLSAALSVLRSKSNFTSTSVFAIQREGAQIGTATFAAGANVATVAYTQTAVTEGQALDLIAPATQDATGADIRGNLRGT